MKLNAFVATVIAMLFSMCTSYLKAQHTVSGKVTERSTSLPVSGAQIIIYTPKDSILFRGATDSSGRYQIRQIRDGQYKINVQSIGYIPIIQSMVIQASDLKIDLSMTKSEIILDEVAVNPNAVLMKGDTMEFDAQRFVTQDFAESTELLKQIPGIEVDEDGDIKAQGEQINRIIVDGREFFSTDPKVALRNLPADIIAKIQIIDDKTEQAKFSGFDDGKRIKVINIVTKPSRRKSYFGKISGGVGSDEKYALNTQVTKMNPKRQYSIDINSNNVNQANGFSVRGNSQPRSSAGLTNRFNSGFNYLDRFLNDRAEFSADYTYSYSDNQTNSTTSTAYTAGSRANQMQYQQNVGHNYTNQHALSVRWNWKIDSVQRLDVRPKLTYQNSNRNSLANSETLENEFDLLNNSIRNTTNDGNNMTWGGEVTYMRRLKKPGRTVSATLSSNINTNKSEASSYAVNTYYRASAIRRIDTVDNQIHSNGDENGIRGKLAFTERIGYYSTVQFNYTLRNTARYSDRKTYEFLAETNQLGELKERLSNEFRNDYIYHSGGISYLFNKRDSSRLQIGIDYQTAHQVNDKIFPTVLKTTSNFNSLLPHISYQYNFTKETSLQVSYNTKTNTPNINQLQDFIDNQNPLRISAGNPNLKQEYDHNLLLQFKHVNKESGTNLNSSFTADFIRDKISNTVLVTDTALSIADGITLGAGGQFTKPENFDGVYNLKWNNAFGYRFIPIKINITLNNNLYFNQNYNLLNQIEVDSKTYGVSQTVGLNSAFSKAIIIGLAYNGSMSFTKNSVTESSNYHVYRHTLSNSLALKLWNSWTFNSTFNYLYNGSVLNSGSGTTLLWNVAFGRKLFKRRNAEVNLTIFDIFNDNKTISQQVNDLWTRTAQSNAVRRYAMLSFTYHLRSLARQNK